MGLTITVGSVTVSINPAASAEPVVAQPGSQAVTYATFAETVNKTGLSQVVFDAFPPVANVNTHDLSKAKWPPQYGTNQKPWGNPAEAETGVREETVIDNLPTVRRWTEAVHSASKGRKSFLEHYADMAFAIATGIKSAFESNVKAGRGVLASGYAFVNVNLSATSEIIVCRRYGGNDGGVLRLGLIEYGTPGYFQVLTSAGAGDVGEFTWLVVG
jgi:hypothetical protein